MTKEAVKDAVTFISVLFKTIVEIIIFVYAHVSVLFEYIMVENAMLKLPFFFF